MRASNGFTRLGAVLKVVGYILFAFAASAGIFGSGGLAGMLVFGVPAAGIWALGWVISGFGAA
ncbi:Uncharacterised protein [Burkholderia pseudomallei]|uniref:hypothetical protein n=1 Tax=Burkholderia pseudomallei TaxID=28450 RepID=UPI0009773457|nr:hypothetical protein [Burkholderia pseudomallei]NAY04699.1 hypothetical protein [Burkholderia pseudomallei]NAY12301.1 hypothetical protein [Burkholderia pseudomallei]NAY38451.1 hypothetical protein [Burkholderia pseudomallei]NAY43796.1 hypothetical protein [Burkholderia pseudomallei]NAY50308.1 hypothetical protein [Burkholderia pseudomallei]